jgi:site-specific DNA recombinase
VRADYLDDLVWEQVTALLADPTLVQTELDRRLTELRHANPATSERVRTEIELARATKAIERLVAAYQEDLNRPGFDGDSFALISHATLG